MPRAKGRCSTTEPPRCPYFILKIISFILVRETERERESSVGKGQRDRERERISSRLRTQQA